VITFTVPQIRQLDLAASAHRLDLLLEKQPGKQLIHSLAVIPKLKGRSVPMLYFATHNRETLFPTTRHLMCCLFAVNQQRQMEDYMVSSTCFMLATWPRFPLQVYEGCATWLANYRTVSS